jgi:hypothetical protein
MAGHQMGQVQRLTFHASRCSLLLKIGQVDNLLELLIGDLFHYHQTHSQILRLPLVFRGQQGYPEGNLRLAEI